jgi:hypothetical protein
LTKVTINGEKFDFDRDRKPLAEMLALEKALNITYGEWESGLQAGSARSMAGFIWLVWRRDGRDIKFADIESGAVEINFGEFTIDEDEGPPGPTTGAGSREASNTTGASTSARSRRSSASGPGRSAS